MKKILSSVFLILIILSNPSYVLATGGSGFRPSTDIINGSGISSKLFSNILRIITAFGSIISVIVIICLGIKYMLGSPSDKADYKKTMLPYVIGAVILFAASTIAQVLFNVFSNI